MTKPQRWTQLTACAAGFAAGWAICYLSHTRGKLLSSEKVLTLVKKAVKQTLPVDGAWIVMSPHTETDTGVAAKVYHGGLTATDEQKTTHYDFTADAHTGTLLKLHAQN
ncbi:MAG: hypothetical protein ABF586_09355 [Sporolactobacillus sp.]